MGEIVLVRQEAILLRMEREREVISRWTGSAPYWEKHRENLRLMFGPVTEAIVEEAQMEKSQTVLDVATGPGEPALTMASKVGAEGKVRGVDAISEMVAAARREASRLGLGNAQFEAAFADELPFADETFDAVVSRFGVMFFPSPVDGIREMLRVLKPGKKLVLAVWHFAEKNPFHYALSRVVDRFVASPPLEPDALEAFRFAAPGKLLELMKEAGVTAASERLMHFKIDAPMTVVDYLTLRLEISEKLREKVSKLSAEKLEEMKREALEAIEVYSTGKGISFPAEILILSGVKKRATP